MCSRKCKAGGCAADKGAPSGAQRGAAGAREPATIGSGSRGPRYCWHQGQAGAGHRYVHTRRGPMAVPFIHALMVCYATPPVKICCCQVDCSRRQAVPAWPCRQRRLSMIHRLAGHGKDSYITSRAVLAPFGGIAQTPSYSHRCTLAPKSATMGSLQYRINQQVGAESRAPRPVPLRPYGKVSHGPGEAI